MVVGNVDRAHVEKLVRGSLGLACRELSGRHRPVPERPSDVVIESRALPTNYILGFYSGPLANSDDYQALRIASVLTGRLFAEIRTRQN